MKSPRKEEKGKNKQVFQTLLMTGTYLKEFGSDSNWSSLQKTALGFWMNIPREQRVLFGKVPEVLNDFPDIESTIVPETRLSDTSASAGSSERRVRPRSDMMDDAQI